MYQILNFDAYVPFDDEPLGTKDKHWFRVKDGSTTTEWLFKKARQISVVQGEVFIAGEDWSEKVASEIAQILGIRAAHVELAEYQGARGCVSQNFLQDSDFSLEHGNEILAGYVFGYDSNKKRQQSDHTVENIIAAVNAMFGVTGGKKAFKDLAHYLVFDALILNTDRHHENWGMLWKLELQEHVGEKGFKIESEIKSYEIAPTFDHASSLGRELLDDKKIQFLAQKKIKKYVDGGRGGIYRSPSSSKGENPLKLVEDFYSIHPQYFRPALLRLKRVELSNILNTVDQIPLSRISLVGKDFAREILTYTYNRLVGLVK